MKLETVRGWLLVSLGGVSVLVGLSQGEPGFVTAGFAGLGAEPIARARTA